MNVIYEDNHLLIIEKKPNQPSQSDRSEDLDVLSQGKNYLIEKYQKPGDAYLALIQRLDRPVGGIMLLAKTSKAASRLNQQMRQQKIKKTYTCIVQGSIQPQILKDYLFKDRKKNRSYVSSPKKKGSKFAQLEILDSSYLPQKHLSKLKIDLITGRSHQIRVQLASRNLPIWGDMRYNPQAQKGQQIALWASSLTFEHPTKKERMTFTCPTPSSYPYNLW